VAAWYTYSYAFRYFDFGIGAASAWVLTLIIGVAAFLYIRLIYREIEY
jgi:ABC-type sugar transport system permease subunit